MTVPPDAREVTWNARWIWPPGRCGRPFQVARFRRSFTLAQVPATVQLHCCADSRYRLWINGVYVGFGPARGPAERPYYDSHDIGGLLRRGKNVMAFLVQHYTAGTPIFAAVQGGLICQLESGAGELLAASGRSWLGLEADAYTGLPGLMFPEAFDARLAPPGWEGLDFDDAAWPHVRVRRGTLLARPEALQPRSIPMIVESEVQPVQILDAGLCRDAHQPDVAGQRNVAKSLARSKLEPSHKPITTPPINPHMPWKGVPLVIKPPNDGKAVYISLDFGRNILASPELTLDGPPGAVVDLGYSEMLEDDRVAPMRQGIAHCDRMILREGTTTHRFLQPRGFRFMMLRLANFDTRITLRELAAHEAIYPAKQIGSFEASDPLLELVFGLSGRTVNLCMEDAFTDCPWRERSQWLGDLQPEALFSYYCFGAYDLVRKAVLDFARGASPEGWVPQVYPATSPANLPTWGMRYPVIVWEYYLHTGDRGTLQQVHRAVLNQMQWLARFEDDQGVLANLTDWCFVDWTKLDAEHGDGAIQGWYLDALDHSTLISDELGDRMAADRLRAKAQRLRVAIEKAYWSEERGAFLKYSPRFPIRPRGASHDLIGQHENFLYSLLRVGSAEMRRDALKAVSGITGKYLPNLGNYQSYYSPGGQRGNVASERTILIGSPFWSFYALLALLDAGEDQAALDYIRLGWGLMLEHGATSCWEMWDRNTSLCHGWSAAPAMILPAYILGVRPTKPGFSEFEIHPRIVDLEWARGDVPTPRGKIRIDWRLMEEGSAFYLEVVIPAGTTARFVPPSAFAAGAIRLDDRPQESRSGGVPLEAGSHRIRILI